MDPRLSMNTFSGPVNQEDLARRTKEYAAQREAYEAGRRQVAGGGPEAAMRRPSGADYDSAPLSPEQREAALQAQEDLAAHLAKRQPSLGEPGKMFSLETILAIFRAEKARMKASYTHEVEARAEVVNTFIAIFENME